MRVDNFKAVVVEKASPNLQVRPALNILNRAGKLGAGHWPFLVILLVYFLLVFGYSRSVPAWEPPDEPSHFAYIHNIRTLGGPPIQSFVEGANKVETGHHPPLYYYIGALV